MKNLVTCGSFVIALAIGLLSPIDSFEIGRPCVRQRVLLTAAFDDNLDGTIQVEYNPYNGKSRNGKTKQSKTIQESGTLGDIMSGTYYEASVSSVRPLGLVTEVSSTCSGTLAASYGITHPLDRMALTANGNLQRLFSSYYDAAVSVVVDSCELVESSSTLQNGKVWHRVVRLEVFGQTFCTATSEIIVRDPLCQELVESGSVGLGQLFRFLDLLPTFELHNAAPKAEGGFWRDYTLSCDALSCRIHEDFCAGLWELKEKSKPQE